MASLLNWFGASKPAAPAAPPGRCLKRVARDVATIRRDHATNLFAEQREAVATTVDCVVCGPEGTPYYGGLFHFRVEHPHSYPVENPTCTNLTTGQGRIGFNPNLYRTGKVCMSILGTWVGPGWNPSHSLSSVLLSIQSLMNDQPCAHLSLHAVAATSAVDRRAVAAASDRWHATTPYAGNEPNKGVARDDPNNRASRSSSTRRSSSRASTSWTRPRRRAPSRCRRRRKRFCAERFLERYDKIIEMVDAEIEKGTSGRLKDPSRASALGLGTGRLQGAPRRSSEAEGGGRGAARETEDDDEEPAVEAKEEPSTPPREAP